MAVKNVTTYYKGILNINWADNGWSEVYNIDAADDASAAIVLTKLANHRSWLLPVTATIVYGRVGVIPNIRRITPITVLPLVGIAPTLTTANANNINDPEWGPCFRLLAEEGRSGTKLIHGVPDDIVIAKKITPVAPGGTWSDILTVPGDGTVQPGTYAVALKNYLSACMQFCVLPSQRQKVIVGGNTVDGFVLRHYIGLMGRDARRHKVGRPFGLARGKAVIR
jgi:hypothetical protein